MIFAVLVGFSINLGNRSSREPVLHMFIVVPGAVLGSVEIVSQCLVSSFSEFPVIVSSVL